MGIGFGLILVAAGAVMAFAVDVSHSHGFNINTVGWILMIVGVVGVVLDLVLFMPRRRVTRTVSSTRPTGIEDTTVVRDREVL
jgi:beta-lactamase regulating signal transducer with metallopeptidase domain